jgi:hypothetical protein
MHGKRQGFRCNSPTRDASEGRRQSVWLQLSPAASVRPGDSDGILERHEHACKVSEAEERIAEFCERITVDKYVYGKGGAFGFCKHHAPFHRIRAVEDWPAIGLKLDPPIKTANPDYATLEEKEEIKERCYRLSKKPTAPLLFPMTRLKQQCARATEGCSKKIQGMAAVLAIHDPAGIVMDLSTMMDWRLAWFNAEQYRLRDRQIVIGGMIENLRKSVMKQAIEDVHNEIKESNRVIELIENDIKNYNRDTYYKRKAMDAQVLSQERVRLKAKQEWLKYPEHIQQEAWKKYEERYDKDQPGKDYANSQEELKAFNKRTIDPLATVHNAWMRSEDLKNYFECNFDPTSRESGYVYTTAFTLCIGNTQQCAISKDLYYRWLKGDILDKGNFLLHALYLNQQQWMEKAEAAKKLVGDHKYVKVGKSDFEWGKFWEEFFGKIGGAVDKTIDDSSNPSNGLLANLVSRMGSVIGQHARDHYSSAANVRQLPVSLVNLAGATRTPLIIVPVNSTAGYDLRVLSDTVFAQAKESKIPVTHETVQNTLGNRGIPQQKLSAPTSHVGLIALDVDASRGKGAELSKNTALLPDAKLNAMLDAGLKSGNFPDVDAFEKEYAKKVSGVGATRAVSSVFSVVSTIVQFVNYLETYKSFANNKEIKPFLKDEQLHKFAAASINMAIAAGDLVEKVVRTSTAHTTLGGRISRGLSAINNSWVVRGLGIVAGLISVAWDVVHAVEARNNGQTGLAWAYLGSAVLGIVGIGLTIAGWFAGAAMAAALTGIGIVVFVIGIGIGILIGWLVGDKLQQWLERCYYGNFQKEKDSKRYLTLEAEMKAFEELQAAAKNANPKPAPTTTPTTEGNNQNLAPSAA